MILDMQTLLSDQQAITATAFSTNVIDLGPINPGFRRDVGKGAEVPMLIQVTQTFNNLTSLGIALQVADDSGFTVNSTTVWSETYLLAQLVAGFICPIEELLRTTNRRYMRLSYTVTGTAPTAGAITAGITMGNQSAPA